MFEKWYLEELFSDKIRNVWKLTDYYLLKLIFNILEETDILRLLSNKISVHEIIRKKEYETKVYSSIKWILDRLTLDEYVKKCSECKDDEYILTDKMMDFNLDEIRNKAKSMAPDSIAAFNMLKLMAENYPAYLSGEKTGVDIIFSHENIDVTNEYYRNNLFYNVHNIAGAKVLNWDIDNREKPVILEIGGGLGGGTCEFFNQRVSENKDLNSFNYTFTDIANKMLRATKKGLLNISENISSFNFKKLDFNKKLSKQNYPEGSVDIIWGVNAAHVAVDLRFTLNEFYKTLKPGGSIILSETVRPIGNTMIQQELLLNTLDDYWNVKLDEQIRPRHGFMDWTDWINALNTIGFKDVQTIPDMNMLQKEYDNCYVSIIRGVK